MTARPQWRIEAQQAGTGERMYATGDTYEEAMTALNGQAYGPVFGTIRAYRMKEAAE